MGTTATLEREVDLSLWLNFCQGAGEFYGYNFLVTPFHGMISLLRDLEDAYPGSTVAVYPSNPSERFVCGTFQGETSRQQIVIAETAPKILSYQTLYPGGIRGVGSHVPGAVQSLEDSVYLGAIQGVGDEKEFAFKAVLSTKFHIKDLIREGVPEKWIAR